MAHSIKTINEVRPNLYHDSVALMQVAADLKEVQGIAEASLMMGTPPNKEMLAEAGLLTSEGEGAGPNDLIVALRGDDVGVSEARGAVERLLQGRRAEVGERRELTPHTLGDGIGRLPQANLAVVSTPGIYAAAEARKALLRGLHVMVFSDNVSIEDERDLKLLAAERGLLLMGPDCGTAIIGGVPLGFANVVRRGPISVVGASGTGIQEITVQVDRYGSGISHAIGTGSRDLSPGVGGTMTILALRALLDDPQTEVVVLVSKPPHPDIAARVLDVAAGASKPVVVVFLGADEPTADTAGGRWLHYAATLEEAAQKAAALAGHEAPRPDARGVDPPKLGPGQKYARGLFSGGTLCAEAVLVLGESLGEIYSNVAVKPELTLRDPRMSHAHTCIDMGADEFTVGRPHPMIEMSTRAERIVLESRDPQVAVLLLDVVLGYGANPDPAATLSRAIREARRITGEAGRELGVIAYVCGTAADPQGLDAQKARLVEAGATLAESNAAAARLAASWLAGRHA